MSDLETMQPKKKWTDYQKDYNISSKAFVHILGTNISLFVCLMIPVLLIGFIWTDFGMPTVDIRFITEGIITVTLFVIGELMMMRVGASGGKLDTEYVNAKTDFDSLVKAAQDIGTMFMAVFCEWQIDVEMEQAIAIRLRYLHLTPKVWEEVKDLPYKELRKKYGHKRAKKIIELKQLEPVELNDAILLYNGNDVFARGGVPISGEEFIYKKSHSAGLIVSSIFTGLLSVSIALTLTSDITFARVMYTACKLIVLLFRMAQGYNTGAKAYNTVEVKQLQSKNNYLRQYIRFVKDKIYLKFGDKYGDISYLVEDTPTETPTVTPTCTNLHQLTPIAEEATN